MRKVRVREALKARVDHELTEQRKNYASWAKKSSRQKTNVVSRKITGESFIRRSMRKKHVVKD